MTIMFVSHVTGLSLFTFFLNLLKMFKTYREIFYHLLPFTILYHLLFTIFH